MNRGEASEGIALVKKVVCCGDARLIESKARPRSPEDSEVAVKEEDTFL